MKKFVLLILVSGFVSLNARAEVGRQDGAKVDCSKVIQAIHAQMKRNRASGDESLPADPDSSPNSRPAT